MRPSRRLALALAAALLLPALGCSSTEPYDYGPYLDHMPRSILVLPPLNESVEPLAPYNYLSTVTAPLAEGGYYVFPVAVVDAMLKANGLPTPGEMHTARLDRIRQIIGADAVLYIRIKDWGTSYQLLNSKTTISVEGSLVDTRTGTVLWTGSHVAAASSSSGESSLVGMFVNALVSQIASTATDHAHRLAGPSASQWFWNRQQGLLLGERHSGFKAQQDQMKRARLEPSTAD